jgi:hypothetical protein
MILQEVVKDAFIELGFNEITKGRARNLSIQPETEKLCLLSSMG